MHVSTQAAILRFDHRLHRSHVLEINAPWVPYTAVHGLGLLGHGATVKLTARPRQVLYNITQFQPVVMSGSIIKYDNVKLVTESAWLIWHAPCQFALPVGRRVINAGRCLPLSMTTACTDDDVASAAAAMTDYCRHCNLCSEGVERLSIRYRCAFHCQRHWPRHPAAASMCVAAQCCSYRRFQPTNQSINQSVSQKHL